MDFRNKIREQQLLDKLNIERKFTPEQLPFKEEDNVFKAFETIEKSDMSPTGAVSAMAPPKGNIEKALDTIDSLLGEEVTNDIIEKGKRATLGETRKWSDGNTYRRTSMGWELVKHGGPSYEELDSAPSESVAGKKKEDFEVDQKISKYEEQYKSLEKEIGNLYDQRDSETTEVYSELNSKLKENSKLYPKISDYITTGDQEGYNKAYKEWEVDQSSIYSEHNKKIAEIHSKFDSKIKGLNEKKSDIFKEAFSKKESKVENDKKEEKDYILARDLKVGQKYT